MVKWIIPALGAVLLVAGIVTPDNGVAFDAAIWGALIVAFGWPD